MAHSHFELAKHFYQINPEFVLSAAETAGFRPTGDLLQLNSYENRVFDLTLEDESVTNLLRPRVIAKLYRPGKWTKAAILEEHQFTAELKAEGFQVGEPLLLANSSTLLTISGIHVAFFRKVAGRMPQEFSNLDLVTIGKRLAHLHSIGAHSDFQHRGFINGSPQSVEDSLEILGEWISPEIRKRYFAVGMDLATLLEETLNSVQFQRLHGDCHRGNLLNDSKDFSFVDFDDALMGPVVQDIWMLLSSMQAPEEEELIVSGYETLRQFPYEQLELIPLLRAYRIINYSTWIARRWDDPTFPNLFPQFQSYNYWAEEVETLESLIRHF
jgi:Ser/Thr protein kinase RdoA (MazF antagonist)